MVKLYHIIIIEKRFTKHSQKWNSDYIDIDEGDSIESADLFEVIIMLYIHVMHISTLINYN